MEACMCACTAGTPNRTILCEYNKAPSHDEISNSLSSAKVFSKSNAENSFWSIHLISPVNFLLHLTIWKDPV